MTVLPGEVAAPLVRGSGQRLGSVDAWNTAPGGAKVPASHETDREAIETALSCIGLTPPEKARVVRITNTLLLGEIQVSEAFLPEVAQRPELTPLGHPEPLAFHAAGRLAPPVH